MDLTVTLHATLGRLVRRGQITPLVFEGELPNDRNRLREADAHKETGKGLGQVLAVRRMKETAAPAVAE